MAYTILIVDDSLPMRSVIIKILRVSGFGTSRFYEAGNGRNALDIMRKGPVDLVVTDYNMPVMDGLDMVRVMKEDPALKTIPVVVISTESSDSRIKEFTALGTAGYVTKPFNPETVREMITSILGEEELDEKTNAGGGTPDF